MQEILVYEHLKIVVKSANYKGREREMERVLILWKSEASQ